VFQLTLALLDNEREILRSAEVICAQIGNRIRVLCVSQCRNPEWFCAFPKPLRHVGDLYQVDLIAMRRHYYAAGPARLIGHSMQEAQRAADLIASKKKAPVRRGPDVPQSSTSPEERKDLTTGRFDNQAHPRSDASPVGGSHVRNTAAAIVVVVS